MQYIYQLLIGTAGFILLYAGLLVYPDERDKISNRLEDVWLKWSDKSDIYEGRFLRLSKSVANQLTEIFNKYFGPEIFSKRSIITSLFLSVIVSPFFTYIFAVIPICYSVIKYECTSTKCVFITVSICIFLTYGWITVVREFIQGLRNNKYIEEAISSHFNFVKGVLYLSFMGPFALSALMGSFSERAIRLTDLLVGFLLIGALSAISLFSDLISIALTRYILGKIAVSKSNYSISIYYLIDAIVAFICASSPALLYLKKHIFLGALGEHSYLILLALVYNITTIIPSIVYILMAFVTGINAIFWPSILRPLYSIIDNRILEKKRSLTIIGGALLGYSIVPNKVITMMNGLIKLL